MLNYVEGPGLPRGLSFAPDAGDRVAIRPTGLMLGAAAAVRDGDARGLAGGRLAFAACEVFIERAGTVERRTAPLSRLLGWAAREGGALERAIGDALDRLSAPRGAFAGLALERALVVGIVNVTPDSFHDGGRHATADAAIAHGESLIAEGADIIDVGAESTRPGSEETPVELELERVIPVLRGLCDRGVVLSVDTRRAAVMRAALDAGARVINDITALTGDSDAMTLAAAEGAHVILMHMQGRPRTMQAAPRYGHAPYEVWRYLDDRVRACTAAGIDVGRIVVDPGIGFGKTVAHNLQLLSSAALLHGTGAAVMVGASRKSFIGRLVGGVASEARLPGSLAAAVLAIGQGVQLVRVHDVSETRQALAVFEGALSGA